MAKEMLINAVGGQECRIAIVGDDNLEEFYFERASSASQVGNIYKGRVVNVEPSIQAAFVDFGKGRNGFLHISDLNPQYFPSDRKAAESVGRKKSTRHRPPIQQCLSRGQELVVQIIKEGIGTKGPTLTTYVSIPGRLLVMMPGMSKLGVSRKIEDEQTRARARAILAELSTPSDIGFIVRTAAGDRSKRDFQRDLSYLLRLWKAVTHRIKTSKAPAEIYQESDLVTRTIRDVYNTHISRIVCDEEMVARKVREFLSVAMPRSKHNIELYTGKEGLFHEYGLEEEIEKIYSRRVELPSGGSLVIDQTEALVAIDVNSGGYREHANAEKTALNINLEAAQEIIRQLRLRDMGGVIIIDFIDMPESKHRRAVEKVLREQLKDDRAKIKISRISSFGIVEMTRQRVRPSLKDSIYKRCEHCNGAGLIKSEESQALLVMRYLQQAISNENVAKIKISVTPTVEHHLVNYERQWISAMEAESGKAITICSDTDLSGDEIKISCTDNRGSSIAYEQTAERKLGKRQLQTISIDDLLRAETNGAGKEDGPAKAKPTEGIVSIRPDDKRRSRRSRRSPKSSKVEQSKQGEKIPQQQMSVEEGSAEQLKSGKKPRRRGSRGGRRRKSRPTQNSSPPPPEEDRVESPENNHLG